MDVLSPLGFRPAQVPLHLALHDATGAAALVEFGGARGKVGGGAYMDAGAVAWAGGRRGVRSAGGTTAPRNYACPWAHSRPSPSLSSCRPPPQTKVYWGATVVTNDPPYPEHQHWHRVWADAIK